MKNLNLPQFKDLRFEAWAGVEGDETCGAFKVKSCVDGSPLSIIAAAANGWDHVSVSHMRRVPNWYEMEQVKRLFFEDHETAMQLHVPPSDHVNNHGHVLHLWRPHEGEIPRPPAILV